MYETLVVFKTVNRNIIGEFDTLADAARCMMRHSEATTTRTKRAGDEIANSVCNQLVVGITRTHYTTVSTITNLGKLATAYNVNLGAIDGMPISTYNVVDMLRELTNDQLKQISYYSTDENVLAVNGATWYGAGRDSWALGLVMRERGI